MTEEALKSTIAQAFLAAGKYYRGNVDGDWGPLSRGAARAWFAECSAAIIAAVIPARRRLVISTPSNETLRTIAAQLLLSRAGHYRAGIDAEWGPLSRRAASAWEDAELGGNLVRFETPYDVARHYIGTKEIPGKQHNSVILNWYRRLLISWVADDETPWCSTFINFCALEVGYERSGKLNARSWLDVGEPIETRDARQGDVMIISRGSSTWEGHVTFLDAPIRSGAMFFGLGGNQNDEVNVSSYPLSKLLGIRRLRSLERLQGPTNKI